MAEQNPGGQAPRPFINLEAQRAHRRQTFWQVYFPLLLAVVVMGVLLYFLLAAGNGGSVETAAQASVILLAFPVLLGGLMLGAAFVLMIVGVGKAIRWLPPQTAKVQKLARGANQATQRAAKSITRVASVLENVTASVEQLFGRGQDE